jgi:hypothetical protein
MHYANQFCRWLRWFIVHTSEKTSVAIRTRDHMLRVEVFTIIFLLHDLIHHSYFLTLNVWMFVTKHKSYYTQWCSKLV